MNVLTVATAVLLADAQLGGETSLVGQGVVVAVLGWFMWRNDKTMGALTRSIDRLVRENAMFVLSLPDLRPAQKNEADKLIAELDSEK